jgi:hypothetical protein
MRNIIGIALIASNLCGCQKEEVTTISSVPSYFQPKGVYEIVGSKYQVAFNTNIGHYHILLYGPQLLKNPLVVDSFVKVVLKSDFKMDVYNPEMSIIGEAQFIDTNYNLPKIKTHNGKIINLKRLTSYHH